VIAVVDWINVWVGLIGVGAGALASAVGGAVVGRVHATRGLRFETYAAALQALHMARHNISNLELDPLTPPKEEPTLAETTDMDARMMLVASEPVMVAFRAALAAANEFFAQVVYVAQPVLHRAEHNPDDRELAIAAGRHRVEINNRAERFREAVAAFQDAATGEVGGRGLRRSRRKVPPRPPTPIIDHRPSGLA